MADRPSVIYLNGELLNSEQACVSPLDRGFALGDGLFETLLVENGQVFRLPRHLARLRDGLARLDINLPSTDAELEAGIHAVLTGNSLQRASARITVSRGVPAERGLLPVVTASGPTVVIQAAPFAGYPVAKYLSGFTAIVATVRRNETSPTAYQKTCNYLDNVFARIEAANTNADEAIMLNTAGLIACGSVSNIFAVSENRILTPSISTGILAGITRAGVIELAKSGGLSVEETKLTIDTLRGGDEAFLTNSLMGVMPLTHLGSSPIGSGLPGPITRLLRARYEALVRTETGPDPDLNARFLKSGTLLATPPRVSKVAEAKTASRGWLFLPQQLEWTRRPQGRRKPAGLEERSTIRAVPQIGLPFISPAPHDLSFVEQVLDIILTLGEATP